MDEEFWWKQLDPESRESVDDGHGNWFINIWPNKPGMWCQCVRCNKELLLGDAPQHKCNPAEVIPRKG